MPVIYGFLERITYYNEENDFTVARLQEKGKRELTTIVGNLSGINAGESFTYYHLLLVTFLSNKAISYTYGLPPERKVPTILPLVIGSRR